jgi:hypothetical protein
MILRLLPFLVVVLLIPFLFVGRFDKRDAATEPPVVMKAGLYSVSFEGGALGFSMPFDENGLDYKTVCVRGNEGDRWIYKAVREQIDGGPECRTEDSKRTGNAISGRVACLFDRREGGGIGSMDYSGTVSEDAVDMVGKLTPPANMGDAMSAEDQQKMELMARVVEVHIKIRREGDC